MKPQLTIVTILFSIISLCGCNSAPKREVVTVEVNTLESEAIDSLYINYPNLSNNVKEEIINLNSLWNDFKFQMSPDKYPIEDFKNSEFLLKLKEFLAKRESLDISATELGRLISQNDISSLDKTYRVDGKEYHFNVIGYNADLYVPIMTDIPMDSKWIFIRCWNEDEFYFTTLSEENYYYFEDFMIVESEGNINVVVSAQDVSKCPYAERVMSFRLDDKGFTQSELFPKENKSDGKWFIDSSGDYLTVGNENNESSNVHSAVNCEFNQEKSCIIFSKENVEEEKTVLSLWFNGEKFQFENN